MPQFSNRAKIFLENKERFYSTLNRDEIIESFKANNAPFFEPLIEFQQKYSGYKFMAGSVPIHFGLLQGDGGYPLRTGTAIIEFEPFDTDSSKYQFVCATSEYPMAFTLDELGRYYEDYKIVASSFDKTIEHFSIWDELNRNKNFKILFQDQKINIKQIDRKLDLTIIPEASDDYTVWFTNGLTYLTQCNGLTTIITSDEFDKVKSILNS